MFRRFKWFSFFIAYNFFMLLFSIVVSGCATSKKKTEESFKEDIICEEYMKAPEKCEGSLWQENGDLNELFMSLKARNVGDIVTISIVEASNASNSANTNTNRESTISAQITNLLGLENNDNFPRGSGFDPFGSINSTASNVFKGAGTTNRSGQLAASISARVTEVLPGGNLKILGKREITVNNEKQYIALSGIIRPRDISPDNVILSTYISDAKIVYTGTGVVDNVQQSGWLTRIFNVIWPF